MKKKPSPNPNPNHNPNFYPNPNPNPNLLLWLKRTVYRSVQTMTEIIYCVLHGHAGWQDNTEFITFQNLVAIAFCTVCRPRLHHSKVYICIVYPYY